MDKQNKRRPAASSGRPIRTTASYMHATKAQPAAEENAVRGKKKTRRASRKNENAASRSFPWLKILTGAAIAAVIVVSLLLILGSGSKVVHQMPKVTPPETVNEAAETTASEAEVTITVNEPVEKSMEDLLAELAEEDL